MRRGFATAGLAGALGALLPACPPRSPAPPSEAPMPDPFEHPVQHPGPGFDLHGEVRRYVEAHEAVIREALPALPSDPALRAAAVEEATARLQAIPETLGPANAALPAKEPFVRVWFDLAGVFRTAHLVPPAHATAPEVVGAYLAAEPRYGALVRTTDGRVTDWPSRGTPPVAEAGDIASIEAASTDAGILYALYPTLGYTIAGAAAGLPARGAFAIDGDAAYREAKATALLSSLPEATAVPLSLRLYARAPGEALLDHPLADSLPIPFLVEVRLANAGTSACSVVVPLPGTAPATADERAPVPEAEWRIEIHDSDGNALFSTSHRVPGQPGSTARLEPGEEVVWLAEVSPDPAIVPDRFLVSAVYAHAGLPVAVGTPAARPYFRAPAP